MVQLVRVCEAANALEALETAFSELEDVPAGAFIVDPVPLEEDGILLFRWLALHEAGVTYPDVIHVEDGSTAPVTRTSDGGYVSPGGEGRWGVMNLYANAHMLEEAVALLIDCVDPQWGHYDD